MQHTFTIPGSRVPFPFPKPRAGLRGEQRKLGLFYISDLNFTDDLCFVLGEQILPALACNGHEDCPYGHDEWKSTCPNGPVNKRDPPYWMKKDNN